MIDPIPEGFIDGKKSCLVTKFLHIYGVGLGINIVLHTPMSFLNIYLLRIIF